MIDENQLSPAHNVLSMTKLKSDATTPPPLPHSNRQN